MVSRLFRDDSFLVEVFVSRASGQIGSIIKLRHRLTLGKVC